MQNPSTEDPKSELHVEHRHLLSGWRFKAMIATVILSIIGYFLFTLWGGWRDVVEASYKVGLKGVLLALALSLVNYLLRFIRWQHYLAILGHKLPFFTHLRIYLAGFALTTTPGKAGEALRSIFLKDYDVPYRKSFGAFLSERFSDLLTVFIISGIGLWTIPQARLPVFILAILIFIGLVALQKIAWLRWLEQFIERKFPGRFAHVMEFGIETILSFRSCYSWSAMIYGTVLGILAWCAEGVAFYYVLEFMGADIGLFTAIYIYTFGLLVGAITLLPGGLGGAEVAMLQLLVLHNVPSGDAVAAILVIRLTTLWFSVILGLAVMPMKHLLLVK